MNLQNIIRSSRRSVSISTLILPYDASCPLPVHQNHHQISVKSSRTASGSSDHCSRCHSIPEGNSPGNVIVKEYRIYLAHNGVLQW